MIYPITSEVMAKFGSVTASIPDLSMQSIDQVKIPTAVYGQSWRRSTHHLQQVVLVFTKVISALFTAFALRYEHLGN